MKLIPPSLVLQEQLFQNLFTAGAADGGSPAGVTESAEQAAGTTAGTVSSTEAFAGQPSDRPAEPVLLSVPGPESNAVAEVPLEHSAPGLAEHAVDAAVGPATDDSALPQQIASEPLSSAAVPDESSVLQGQDQQHSMLVPDDEGEMGVQLGSSLQPTQGGATAGAEPLPMGDGSNAPVTTAQEPTENGHRQQAAWTTELEPAAQPPASHDPDEAQSLDEPAEVAAPSANGHDESSMVADSAKLHSRTSFAESSASTCDKSPCMDASVLQHAENGRATAAQPCSADTCTSGIACSHCGCPAIADRLMPLLVEDFDGLGCLHAALHQASSHQQQLAAITSLRQPVAYVLHGIHARQMPVHLLLFNSRRARAWVSLSLW